MPVTQHPNIEQLLKTYGVDSTIAIWRDPNYIGEKKYQVVAITKRENNIDWVEVIAGNMEEFTAKLVYNMVTNFQYIAGHN